MTKNYAITETNMKAERITANPDVHFGEPCVAGTRITVQDVLELLDAGLACDVIVRDYFPELTTDDIDACRRYAADREVAS